MPGEEAPRWILLPAFSLPFPVPIGRVRRSTEFRQTRKSLNVRTHSRIPFAARKSQQLALAVSARQMAVEAGEHPSSKRAVPVMSTGSNLAWGRWIRASVAHHYLGVDRNWF